MGPGPGPFLDGHRRARVLLLFLFALYFHFCILFRLFLHGFTHIWHIFWGIFGIYPLFSYIFSYIFPLIGPFKGPYRAQGPWDFQKGVFFEVCEAPQACWNLTKSLYFQKGVFLRSAKRRRHAATSQKACIIILHIFTWFCTYFRWKYAKINGKSGIRD